MNSENAHKVPKQWETRLNGRINKKQQEWEKMRFYEIGEFSYSFLTY